VAISLFKMFAKLGGRKIVCATRWPPNTLKEADQVFYSFTADHLGKYVFWVALGIFYRLAFRVYGPWKPKLKICQVGLNIFSKIAVHFKWFSRGLKNVDYNNYKKIKNKKWLLVTPTYTLTLHSPRWGAPITLSYPITSHPSPPIHSKPKTCPHMHKGKHSCTGKECRQCIGLPQSQTIKKDYRIPKAISYSLFFFFFPIMMHLLLLQIPDSFSSALSVCIFCLCVSLSLSLL
jgi:hypothetical protein